MEQVPGDSTLQYIVLELVSKNLRLFVNAYSVSEDPIVRKGLEFLRRVYSFYLISNKLEDGVLDPEYFDLLLNEHLKELNFAIFHVNHLDQVLKCLKDFGHGISKASFEHICAKNSTERQGVKEFISNAVCCLPNIKILNIKKLCTDDTLLNISTHCHILKELYIDRSSVTCSGLELLCSNDRHRCALKVLSLKGIQMQNIPVHFLLRNMPSLEVLHHPKLGKMIYGSHESDLENNSVKTTWKFNLTTLEITAEDYATDTDIDAVDYATLPISPILPKRCSIFENLVLFFSDVCPKVTTLTLNFNEKFDIMLVSRFCNLENLKLHPKETTLDLDDFLIKNGKKLKSLTIDDDKWNKFDLSLQASVLVQSCTELQYLKIQMISFQSISNADVKPLSKLQELIISDFNFSLAHVEESVDFILKCSPKLKHLMIDRCQLKDSQMNTKLTLLFKNSALEQITFTEVDVEEALLQTAILTCPAIKTITLEYCDNITHDQIRNLSSTAEAMPNFIEVIRVEAEEISDDSSNTSGEEFEDLGNFNDDDI